MSEVRRSIIERIESRMNEVRKRSDPYSNGIYVGLLEALNIAKAAKGEESDE